MKPVRASISAGALLLAACATEPLVSTLPAEPARLDLVGRAVPALPADTVDAKLAEHAADLQGRLPAATLNRAPDGSLRLRLAAAGLFEAGSAQLKAAALAPCSELAAGILAFESSVLHVLAYGEADATEPEAALGARRAASLLDYLVRRGVPPTRLRAEGRSATAGSERVDLVLVPVVQGREARAWVPPPDSDG